MQHVKSVARLQMSQLKLVAYACELAAGNRPEMQSSIALPINGDLKGPGCVCYPAQVFSTLELPQNSGQVLSYETIRRIGYPFAEQSLANPTAI